MKNDTFFKTPEGVFYSVSERIMNSGYAPNNGSIIITDEEVGARRNSVTMHRIPRLANVRKEAQKSFESSLILVVPSPPEELVENITDPVVKELPVKTPQNLPATHVVEATQEEPVVEAPKESASSLEDTLDFENLISQGLSLSQINAIKIQRELRSKRAGR